MIEKAEQVVPGNRKAEVIRRLGAGEGLENLILTDLNLAGLELEGVSFRGADIRGVSLYREEESEDGKTIETTTNIRGADFTDAIFAGGTDFYRVDAEGTIFGYTESIDSRRKSHPGDCGGLFRFDGCEGNFKETRWTNIDFGGGTEFEAMFFGADLSGAVVRECLLAEIDLSETTIEGITIIDPAPISLNGLKINKQQIESLAQAIKLADKEEQ